jgi:hypothetical protein
LTSAEETGLDKYPRIRVNRLKDFACPVLSQPYILCCRLFETLRCTGEKAFLRHESLESTAEDFWDLVLGGGWEAALIRNEAIFYASRMLESEDYVLPERFVQKFVTVFVISI